MGKLAEWCKDQPSWVSDALHRAASVDEITQTQIDAVAARVAEVHGIPVEGHHSCEAFSEEVLRPTNSTDDDVLLCSIGPLTGVDRLADNSERGTSFFEVALATEQRTDKEEVLSEGEQRALSIACFLAESHIAGRKSAIILDDPVTSLDHKRLRRVAERLVREAATGRQIVIFTHNMLFYQEVLRACADREPQVPVLPSLVHQFSKDRFGLVANDDQPWVAKKVKERERYLEEKLKAVPEGLPADGDELRQAATAFYTDLRETWERVVEEILLNAVVERFGTDVKTQSLKGVEVTDEDYKIVFNAMKRASEYSGHDRAAARQLDPPSKDQMQNDLNELKAFRATRQKRRNELQDERKKLEAAPTAETI